MKKYTKNTTLQELLSDKKALNVLKKFQVPCLHCPFASIEMEKLTLEEITRFYGIDIKKLLKNLNQK